MVLKAAALGVVRLTRATAVVAAEVPVVAVKAIVPMVVAVSVLVVLNDDR